MIRRGLLLILCLVLSTIAIADNNQIARIFNTDEVDNDYIDMTLTLPCYSIDTIEEAGTTFKQIRFDNSAYFLDLGKPELPYFSSFIAVPDGSSINSIEILSYDAKQLNGVIAYPAQDYEKPEETEFHFDSEFYNSNKSYPYQESMIGESATLRDLYLCNFSVAPIFYDPLKEELEIRDNMKIRVHLNNSRELLSDGNTYSSSFEKIYEAYVDNFDMIRHDLERIVSKRILIIHKQVLDASFNDKVTEFAEWKMKRGFQVDTFDTSVTGTGNTSIKNFIQGRYDNIDTRPDYLIIIGDVGGTLGVPTFTESISGYGGCGDHPYTHLEGIDTIGDIFVGRMSAENTNQFLTLANKVFYYERDMPLAVTDWYDKMLLVGDTEPSGQSCVYVNEYIQANSRRVNPNYSYTELYGGNPSPSSMNTAISQGVGVYNYRGYIGMSNWHPNASSLNNGDRLCHSTILTCSTGTFSSTSTTEEFIRLGSPTLPKGALTAIGMATPGTHTHFNNALASGIWNGILNFGMRDLGSGLLAGELNLYNQYNNSNPSQVEYFSHWCNLMGDPTVTMYLTVPKQFDVTIPSIIPSNTALVPVHVHDEMLSPMEDAIVTAYQSGTLHYITRTDANGVAYIDLPIDMTGTVEVTVSADNYKSSMHDLIIDSAGGIIYARSVLSETVGNDNGLANAGETLDVSVALYNSSASPINNVTATLTSTTDYITVNQNSVDYGTIVNGNNSTGNAAFNISINNACPDAFVAYLNLSINSDNGSTYTIFAVPVQNGDLDFTSVSVIDSANGILDPGDTAELLISITNDGEQDISSVEVELTSLNALVVVEDMNASIGDIPVGTTMSNANDQLVIRARSNLLPGMVIPFQLNCFNADGYQENIRFDVEVGSVTESDPFGPDEYGYFIYHSDDVTYPDCPSYEWIEISPEYGGSGTSLGLDDPSSWTEGDAVGAVSILPYDLPFDFTFYGETYDRIWISSNGFISFLETECADWRNNVLFGAMTQNGIVAPFWDDLATTDNNSVTTYYDANLSALIIEWDVEHGSSSLPQRFQVLMYHPDANPTSTGDGMIKIQYHTFSNNNDTNNCTVGIKDHTGTKGLQYSFDNQYPNGANQINAGDALLITGSPISLEEPFLVLGDTVIHDQNNNHIVEPGEEINLGVNIVNMGSAPAENVEISVTCESPYVSVTQNSSTYDIIPGEGNMFGDQYITLSIAESAPDNHEIILTVNINSPSNEWTRVTSLSVVSNKLRYLNAQFNDQVFGNGDKVVQAGETFFLCVNLENPEVVATRDVQVGLSSSYPGVVIVEDQLSIGDIAPESALQCYFEITMPDGIADMTFVPFEITYFATGIDIGTAGMTIGIGLADFDLDFEQSNGGLTQQGGWQWGFDTIMGAHSGTRVWGTYLSGNYPVNHDAYLYTPILPLSDNAELRFWHKYEYDNHYDGGNIQISTDSGATWQIITPVSGYDDGAVVSLDNQPGFTGISGAWEEVVIDLSDYANMNVQFQWYSASDYHVNDNGWYIDDVTIVGFIGGTGYISGNIALSGDEDITDVCVSNGEVAVHPDENGDYYIFQKDGNYDIHAYTNHYSEGFANRIMLNETNQSNDDIDFALQRLNEPTDLSCVQDDYNLNLTWNAPDMTDLTFLNYNIYKSIDSAPYALIGSSEQLAYADTLSYSGTYKYYVTAMYSEGEGFESDIISFIPDMTDIDDESVPVFETELIGNYPNPFNPTTTICFALKQPQQTSIKVYNIKGQLVKTLFNDNLSTGNHTIVWDGTDSDGRGMATGIYFFRMECEDYCKTIKSLLIK